MATQIDRDTPDGVAFLDGLSDEDLALFAESLAVQRELEAEDAAAGVVPLRPRPRRPLGRVWVGLAAAAVIAAVALPFARREAYGTAVREPSQAVGMLAGRDAGTPPGYDGDRPWGQTRGGVVPPTPEARATRLGAFVVDLELAIRGGETEEIYLLSERAALLLEAAATGPDAARRFRELGALRGGDRERLLAELATATDAAERAVDRDRFLLGAWAEAALIAAESQDAGFFRSGKTRGTLRRAERLLDEGEARQAVRAVRAAAGADPLDWARLETAIRQLLARTA